MKENNNINRRNFLKIAGGTAAAATVTACSGSHSSKTDQSADTGKMEYRKSSKGDTVSLLGYGCMRWPTMDADAKGVKAIDQEEVNRLVDYAIAHGVNYFDTAPVYLQGQSEAATGIALKRHPRESYFIATKLSNQRGSHTKDEALEMYHNSLKNLQTDYIDYLLLHYVGGTGQNLSAMELLQERFFSNGVLDYLVKEREEGRIRHLGWSFHGDVEVFDYMLRLHDEGKYKWDFVQIQMNYIDWKMASTVDPDEQNAEYLYNELSKRGIPVVIMEPLLGGQLSRIPDHFVRELKEMEPGNSVASWAFRFCGTHPGVMTVLSGMTYMEHLKDNVETFTSFKPLTDDEIAFLTEDIAPKYVKYPLISCTNCKYCMPCPYGVDIPGVFAHYNKCVNDDLVEEDSQSPDYRKARRAFLTSLDRNVEKLRQADHCIKCGQCLKSCPQRIRIPQQMSLIDQYTEKLKRSRTL